MFERGATDTFIASSLAPLGELTTARVYMENCGFGDGWHMEVRWVTCEMTGACGGHASPYSPPHPSLHPKSVLGQSSLLLAPPGHDAMVCQERRRAPTPHHCYCCCRRCCCLLLHCGIHVMLHPPQLTLQSLCVTQLPSQRQWEFAHNNWVPTDEKGVTLQAKVCGTSAPSSKPISPQQCCSSPSAYPSAPSSAAPARQHTHEPLAVMLLPVSKPISP